MTEVSSWPKGREKAIMVGVNEITAGRSIKQRKKRVGSELARWDFNRLPGLGANWSGSCKEVLNGQGKVKFCIEVLVWEPWCAASGALGHQFLDFVEKLKPRQV